MTFDLGLEVVELGLEVVEFGFMFFVHNLCSLP